MKAITPPMPSTATAAVTQAKNLAAARKANKKFKAMFLGQMIAHLFDGVGDDKLFGGGEAGKLFRSMMQEEYGKTTARAGGIGIADAVAREVLKLQERAGR